VKEPFQPTGNNMTNLPPEPPRDYGPPQYQQGPAEAPGSSATTALAVGAGAVVGAVAIAAAAPVILPIIGLGAVVGMFVPVVGATIGAYTGWKMFGSK